MFSIRTIYPDSICYRPDGATPDSIAAHVLMGNPDGVDPDSLARSVSSGRGVPTPCTWGRILSGWHSTSSGYPTAGWERKNSVRRHFTSGYPTAGWEMRTLQLLQIDISGSSDSAYPQSFSLSIQCSGVLLKLPVISDRHLEIF